jgi:hypothetical protein
MNTYIFTFKEGVNPETEYGNRDIEYKIEIADGAHYVEIAEQFEWFLSAIYGYPLDITIKVKEKENDEGE